MSGVMLGEVVLQGYEVPERVRFGGTQRLAVHRLPGGGRVVDAMGPDELGLRWSGMMLGADAADRARAIDAMRVAGTPVTLVFGDMAYDVIVAGFVAEYRRRSWIGAYAISCAVLPAVAEAAGSARGQVSDGLATAAGLDPEGGLPGLAASVAAARTALGAAGVLAGDAALRDAVVSARGVAGAVAAGAEAALEGWVGAEAVGGPGGLLAASGQAGLLARAGAIGGLLGQAIVSVEGAG